MKNYTVINRQAEIGDTVLVFDELATVISRYELGWNTRFIVRNDNTGEELTDLWSDELQVVE